MIPPDLTTGTSCPRCGRAVTGRFCSECGAPAEAATCGRCGTPLAAGVRFCPECGRRVSGPSRVATDLVRRWAPAGLGVTLLLALLALVARREPAPPPTPAAGLGGVRESGALPDLSQMSPRERFDRLYNRVMQASEAGDTAQVMQFTPMALMAYAGLDQVDADARYHAAMLRLHTGDPAGARALADSILATQPEHLFGYLIHGALARWDGNAAALANAQREFARAYDAEIAAGRPEYRDHQQALDRFRAQARDGR